MSIVGRYVQVENGIVVKHIMPEVVTLKDGTTMSKAAFRSLDPEMIKNEGWMPLIADNPVYNPVTQHLVFDKYTINENSVNVSYTVAENAGIDIEYIRMMVIKKMNDMCQERIIYTFRSTAFDGIVEKHYDCEWTDQSRIAGLVSIAQLRLGGLSTEILKWKGTGESVCYEWSPEAILRLGLDLKRHIETNTDRFNMLRIWASDNLRTAVELQNWSWDMSI